MSRITFFIGVILAAILFGWCFNKTAALQPDAWRLDNPSTDRQIEGYADKVSVAIGDQLGFHVSCTSGGYRMTVYRAGYYGGLGRMLMGNFDHRSCQQESMPLPDRTTGLVIPSWPISRIIRMPADWPAGMYFAELISDDGHQSYVPFLVRSAYPQHQILFVHSVNTDNAYNIWGGNSSYRGNTPALNVRRGIELTFKRPFSGDGSGLFFNWEFPMVKFLDKYGYDVDYISDVDIDKDPAILTHYRVVVIAGHDEYWSRPMRDGYIRAIKQGTNLAVFGANTAFRAIRYTNGREEMIDYKDATIDPVKNTSGSEIPTPQSWRDEPLNNPESEIIGLSWGGENLKRYQPADMAVAANDSWILSGTGLKPGDKLTGLVGYEYDKNLLFVPKPAPVKIIFHSPLINSKGIKDYADAGLYTMPGGGSVFDAGTILWSSGLRESSEDYSPQLVKITRNILNHFSSSLQVTELSIKP